MNVKFGNAICQNVISLPTSQQQNKTKQSKQKRFFFLVLKPRFGLFCCARSEHFHVKLLKRLSASTSIDIGVDFTICLHYDVIVTSYGWYWGGRVTKMAYAAEG